MNKAEELEALELSIKAATAALNKWNKTRKSLWLRRARLSSPFQVGDTLVPNPNRGQYTHARKGRWRVTRVGATGYGNSEVETFGVKKNGQIGKVQNVLDKYAFEQGAYMIEPLGVSDGG